jgi:diaminopimelate epimerase
MISQDRESRIETDSGVITARFRGGLPEIDLRPVTELDDCFKAEPATDEQRIGFAMVGVPHLVILCRDVGRSAVLERGRKLRHDRQLPQGANVNFVSKGPGGWHVRTYERGVEAETLACGTGAVATALLLTAWGEAPDEIELITRSGRKLRVRHRTEGEQRLPSLSGEARIVFVGTFGELVAPTT